jgi:hypothetical protein
MNSFILNFFNSSYSLVLFLFHRLKSDKSFHGKKLSLSTKLVERLLRAHTNLVLRESLDAALHLLPGT